MSTLEDTVRVVVKAMLDTQILFTALDVSNQVKVILPHTRHREVRDIVRAMYANEIQTQGWGRTNIPVVLEDGSSAQAALYHPLSATWDLDIKYDQQKRAQIAADPVKAAAAAVLPSNTVPAATWGGTALRVPTPVVPVVIAPTVATPVATPVTPTTPMPTARDTWKQLFATQPSLFPKS